MKRTLSLTQFTRLVVTLGLALPFGAMAASYSLMGWNDLGMHCMDSDYSVFSILPPYNTIHGQFLVQGHPVTPASGYTITYEAVADPSGSSNSTSEGKTQFWQYIEPLYGVALPVNMGLAGYAMPGSSNAPQTMHFETNLNWFTAEGIPLTPFDDAGQKNYYPLMRLIAWDAGNNPVATNDIVLPISDEMDCRACHASGTASPAEPAAGWVWAGNPERDYRLNILRLHDEMQASASYSSVLASNDYNPAGLYRSVTVDGKPVLCAKCHRSNALPGTGFGTIPPLTQAIHSRHATVTDPETGLELNNIANRASCYRCHPGSETRCLRGVMGDYVAANGSRAIQCQSCHGSMSAVGAATREGWFNEPNCQACHTGTATSNNGQIRYDNALLPSGQLRQPVNATFATQPNVPVAGLTLYRFSTGHGGLQCEACHGSTHAEYPSHANDNIRIVESQGHAGVLSECTACHTTMPVTVNGGPHGMHPVGQTWVSRHGNVAEDGNSGQCQVCHGTDYRGTVLSKMQADRTLSAFGTKHFWRGFQVGCYACHNGPGSESATPNTPALVNNVSASTTSENPVAITLPASDVNGNPLTLRIVSQPQHGALALNDTTATYVSDPGFVGTDTFTFAAWDGSTDSNLGTGTVTVAQGAFSISAKTLVPPEFPADWPVPFVAYATASNVNATVTYDWDFGDGTTHGTDQFSQHTYSSPVTYSWTLIATVQAGATQASTTETGTVQISQPMTLAALHSGNQVLVSWPRSSVDAILEANSALAPTSPWYWLTNTPTANPDHLTLTIDNPSGASFYRLRRAQ